MSRTALFISLAGFALSVIPENFRSPLSYGDNNWLVANVTGTQGGSLLAKLTSGSLNVIGAAVENVLVTETVSFTMSSNPQNSVSFELARPFYTGSSLSSTHIGIGFDSDLTQAAGSIAVIRNTITAELVFGATEDYFTSSCVAGTLMTLNASATGGIFLWNPIY
jgi:hypothetical protein